MYIKFQKGNIIKKFPNIRGGKGFGFSFLNEKMFQN